MTLSEKAVTTSWSMVNKERYKITFDGIDLMEKSRNETHIESRMNLNFSEVSFNRSKGKMNGSNLFVNGSKGMLKGRNVNVTRIRRTVKRRNGTE